MSSRILSAIIPHPGKQYGGDLRKKVFTAIKATNSNIKSIIYIAALHHMLPKDEGKVYVVSDALNIFKSNNKWLIDKLPPNVEKEHSYKWVKQELIESFPNAIHTVLIPGLGFPIKRLAPILCRYLNDNRNSILIGTTDLIHYGPNYNITGWAYPEQSLKIMHETPLIEALLKTKTKSIESQVLEKPFLCCGPQSIQLISAVSSLFMCKAIVIDYYDSDQSQYEENDINRYCFSRKPIVNFVSYVGIIYLKKIENTLSEIDQKLALGAVRSRINMDVLTSEKTIHPLKHKIPTFGFIPRWTKWSSMMNGIFVGTSVYKNGTKKTNSSYGRYETKTNSAHNMIEAAGDCYRDSIERWNIPLKLNGNVNYKVEILDAKKDWITKKAIEIKDYTKEIYGYYLTFKKDKLVRGATYLPGVWQKSLSSKSGREMLSHLAGKSLGIGFSDAWKLDKQATIKLYKSKKIEYDSKKNFIF